MTSTPPAPGAPPPRRRPHPHDLWLAAGGVAVGVLLWSLGVHSTNNRGFFPPWFTLVPLVAMGGLALLRRIAPGWTLLPAVPVLVVDQFTVGSTTTMLLFTDVMYAAALYGPPALARRLPMLTGVLTGTVALVLPVWTSVPTALLFAVLAGLVLVTPAQTGIAIRNHRDLAAEARARAEQTALLAESDRRRAVRDERARMARELHDLVAGHLSAIAVHSTAALSLDSPATSREALGVIRESSVQGLAEMRRMIEVLRAGPEDEFGRDARPAGASDGPPAPAEPVPSPAGIGSLVERARAVGTATGLEPTLSDPEGITEPSGRSASGPGTPVPVPVGMAAYRIVQEALTNALKHAGPGPVPVRLESTGPERGRGGGRELVVEVDSPLPPAASRPRAPGSGSGLVGIRERSELLHGSFAAGPVDGGLWRVRVTLPLDDPTP
ncbi:sensor histidine kinase [Streptomyces sp. BI20]|uniref:sensor histidine kinase n=1 Tax=Streptomyces sp. BI20 TaxID=3403460 RepID=UPI003C770C69